MKPKSIERKLTLPLDWFEYLEQDGRWTDAVAELIERSAARRGRKLSPRRKRGNPNFGKQQETKR